MLTVDQISKYYDGPDGRLAILTGVSLVLRAGESAAIMGPSGCGKSTLLNALGALEPPSAGSIALDGVDPYTLGEREQARFRNAQIGFVFQDHCLLPQLSARENVLTPLLVGAPDKHGEEHTDELLRSMGLGTRSSHRPAELSGGEKQRVAIARALVRRPKLLLCDEPTGNLDPHTAATVAGLLRDLPAMRNTIVVVVTHSAEVARQFQRVYRLDDGKLCDA